MTRKIIIFLVIIAILVSLAYAMLKNEVYNVINAKSCYNNANSDDCLHKLAHQNNDIRLCETINDSKLKEHCMEHIPR